VKEVAGDTFQQETKYHRGKLPTGGLDRVKKPELYKRYHNVPVTELDPPLISAGGRIWEIIKNRRSVRSFGGPEITADEISQLLWATQGITVGDRNFVLRAAPSAGALYPIETYLIINRVKGLEPGIYHYEIETHALSQLKSGNFREKGARAALDQVAVETADTVFIWSAVFDRAKWKYKQRAYRYIYMEAGHIAQNLAIAAVELGLGTCQIGALYDDEVNGILGLDGYNESVIYMSSVGRQK